MIIQQINSTPNKSEIPESLRYKTINSHISSEIFFLDCINDLLDCSKSNSQYHLIRASSILRMLLKDNIIEHFAKQYNCELNIVACKGIINGKPISNTIIRNNLEKLFARINVTAKKSYLNLLDSTTEIYSIKDFKEKILLSFQGEIEINFSVLNIINLIANKHGGAHLETEFESSNIDSFHLAEFNPFSINPNSFFLVKLKEIMTVLIMSIADLRKKIIGHLKEYDNSFTQADSGPMVCQLKNMNEIDKINNRD